jgi:hypothetical protein
LNGYILAGSAGRGDLGWLMKVDEKGNVMWEREYKGPCENTENAEC